MKEHFKKHEIAYLIIFSACCLILSTVFIYLGTEAKKKNRYTKEEAIGIMKLKADQLTRLIEISSSDDTCKKSDKKQIVSISITGKGSLSEYQLKNYVSNQVKK